VEQEMIKDSIQRAKDLSPSEVDLILMRELLAQLENGAAKLSAAMFGAPESMQGDGWPQEDEFDSDASAQKLMKSALKDMNSKR